MWCSRICQTGVAAFDPRYATAHEFGSIDGDADRPLLAEASAIAVSGGVVRIVQYRERRPLIKEPPMDLLTKSELNALASRKEQRPAVSLFMPTHRFGSDTVADPLRWKNLLTGATDALGKRGLHKNEIDELLAPATMLLDEAIAWQYMSDGLAVYIEPGWDRTYRVPFQVPEIATIGNRLTICPLLPATSRGNHFLILTVSQRHIRLLEATRDSAEEVELRELPTSLLDVIEAPDPRSDTMTRSLAGGSSGPAVFYGHGAADDDFKTEETTKFFRQVAAGLHEYLADQHVPMVLIGLERATSIFREVCPYAHLTTDSVRQNPDQLTLEELHRAAWPVVAEQFAASKRALGDRFEALHGTGQASTDPIQIDDAAVQGRIETLFIATEPWEWQSDEARTPTIVDLEAVGPAGSDGLFARLERTAVATMAGRGDIFTVSGPTVPGGSQLAATFRY